ncbi:hypothetical protein F5887DRAFT_921499 [Amanita rubescens]|nr:hypothetical protein F5887DRAFT_921499 [Amanita rubescens]
MGNEACHGAGTLFRQVVVVVKGNHGLWGKPWCWRTVGAKNSGGEGKLRAVVVMVKGNHGLWGKPWCWRTVEAKNSGGEGKLRAVVVVVKGYHGQETAGGNARHGARTPFRQGALMVKGNRGRWGKSWCRRTINAGSGGDEEKPWAAGKSWHWGVIEARNNSDEWKLWVLDENGAKARTE